MRRMLPVRSDIMSALQKRNGPLFDASSNPVDVEIFSKPVGLRCMLLRYWDCPILLSLLMFCTTSVRHIGYHLRVHQLVVYTYFFDWPYRYITSQARGSDLTDVCCQFGLQSLWICLLFQDVKLCSRSSNFHDYIFHYYHKPDMIVQNEDHSPLQGSLCVSHPFRKVPKDRVWARKLIMLHTSCMCDHKTRTFPYVIGIFSVSYCVAS